MFTQSGCDNGERSCGGVTHVFINIIDIGSHCRDHSGQASSFG